jgi:HK97 family phage prohead protease
MQYLNVAIEIKSLGSREFEGHGSIFGNLDLGGDIVLPGAFKRSLARHTSAGTLPQMFWMHKPDQVPGRWLEMEEDSKGLYVRGELADTTLGNDMHKLLKMKAVRGQSIGYSPVDVDYDKDGNRLLKEVDLWEVSLVSLAMNPLATVEAVKSRLSSVGEYVPTEREFERLLRDAGCSRKVATTLVAKLYGPESISGMLNDHLRDAGMVDHEAEALKTLLARDVDKMLAASMRQ